MCDVVEVVLNGEVAGFFPEVVQAAESYRHA